MQIDTRVRTRRSVAAPQSNFKYFSPINSLHPVALQAQSGPRSFFRVVPRRRMSRVWKPDFLHFPRRYFGKALTFLHLHITLNFKVAASLTAS